MLDIILRLDTFLEACKTSKKKKKKVNEQLDIKSFQSIDKLIKQKDEFGIDAVISQIQDRVEDEMELIMKLATPDQMKDVKMAFNKFYKPFDKAMKILEGDPLNDSNYKKALKTYEDLIKAYKKLV